ncbi:hypothetical protein C7271_09965 [filamentous cyanobacterium CCP5]|nr:hypothetical protein C7271_09965 [filamentous cyanobacterium CCP5]
MTKPSVSSIQAPEVCMADIFNHDAGYAAIAPTPLLVDLDAPSQGDPIMSTVAPENPSQSEQLTEPNAYVFFFDDQLGRLDYVLANPLLQEPLAGTTNWYVDAAESPSLDGGLGLSEDPAAVENTVLYRSFNDDSLIVGFTLDGEFNVIGAGVGPVTGTEGSDLMVGGDVNATLFGGDGSDILEGGSGNDKLYGENGSDWLIGSSGFDLLFGGDGTDVVVYEGLRSQFFFGGIASNFKVAGPGIGADAVFGVEYVVFLGPDGTNEIFSTAELVSFRA